MSEELQSAMERKEFNSLNSKAKPQRSKTPGGLSPRCSLLLLCFLLLAFPMFLLYLTWCDYYVKGSHRV